VNHFIITCRRKLNETSIVKFVGTHPLDVLIKDATSSGDAEKVYTFTYIIRMLILPWLLTTCTK